MTPVTPARNSGIEPYSPNDRLLIFPASKPTLPRLFYEVGRVVGQDHGGTTCPRNREDDARPQWMREDILTKAEELSLYASCKAGDTKAREDLIRGNLRSCAKAATMYRGNLDFDVAHSAAVIGLITALDAGNFDPEKGRLGTFAWKAMKGEIFKAIRGAQVVPRPGRAKPSTTDVAFQGVMTTSDESFDAPLRYDDGAGSVPTLHDKIAADVPTSDRLPDLVDAAGHRAALLRALDTLTERERRIFVARRLSDEPPTCKKLGLQERLSGERVRQIEEAATSLVFKAVPHALARLETGGRPCFREKITPAQVHFGGLQRRIVKTLFRPRSNRTYRQRCRDIFLELVELGDTPLRAVQRIRWVILKWCRNRRIAFTSAAPDRGGRYLSARELLDLGFSPATIAGLRIA